MDDLFSSIARLNDRQAIQAAAWATEAIWRQLQQTADLPELLRGNQLTDDQAVDQLSLAYPDLASSLEHARIEADEQERGRVARAFLLVAAEQGNSGVVADALEQAQFVFPPVLLGMAVAAGIVFLLSVHFKVQSKGGKLSWEVSRDSTPKEIVEKILNPLPDVLKGLLPKSDSEDEADNSSPKPV